MRWVFERGQTEIILAPTGALGLDFAGKLTKVDPRLVHGPVEIPELPALRRVHLLPTEAEYVLPETEAYCELFGRPGDRLLAAAPLLQWLAWGPSGSLPGGLPAGA